MTKENQRNLYYLLFFLSLKGKEERVAFFHLQEIISGQLRKWATLIFPTEKQGMPTSYRIQASY